MNKTNGSDGSFGSNDLDPGIKKPLMRITPGDFFRRSEAESNRCGRFCRPLPDRSATRPFVGAANIQIFTIISDRMRLIRCLFTQYIHRISWKKK